MTHPWYSAYELCGAEFDGENTEELSGVLDRGHLWHIATLFAIAFAA